MILTVVDCEPVSSKLEEGKSSVPPRYKRQSIAKHPRNKTRSRAEFRRSQSTGKLHTTSHCCHKERESLGRRRVRSRSLDTVKRNKNRCSAARIESEKSEEKRSGKQRKTVRFQTTADGDIIELHVAAKKSQEPLILSASEVSNMWWTPAEEHVLRERAQGMVEMFKDCRPNHRDAGIDLLTAAIRSHGSPDLVATDPHTIQRFVDCSARGLEKRVLPILRRKRQYTIRALLSHQERLLSSRANDNTNCILDKHLAADILALSYERITQYSAMWALIMATGDALAAAEEVMEEQCSSSSGTSMRAQNALPDYPAPRKE